MSTCLACPPLSCNMDCDASKQLVSTPTYTEQTDCPASSSNHQTSDLVAAAASLQLANPKIDQLPNELKNQILECLEPDLDSIKNIRLVSRSWAFFGAPYLLSPTFNALPHRDDFTRLVEVSQHPYFSQQIKTLNIRWMTIDEEQLRLTLIAPHGGFTYDEENFRTSWGQYRKMKGLIDLYSDTFCNEQLLTQAFKGLTQISELDVNPDCYLFPMIPTNSYLYDAFRAMKLRMIGPETTPEYPQSRENSYNILSALTAANPPRIRTVSCNFFPLVVWQGAFVAHQFGKPITRELLCLKLHIGHDGPLYEALTGWPLFDLYAIIKYHEVLGICLSNAKELRELHLTGDPVQVGIPALPSSLTDAAFPHLHTVVLRHFDWPLPGIQKFLYNQRRTIRRVRLETQATRQYERWGRDIKSLLKMMKNEMHIQQLDFRGLSSPRRGPYSAADMLKKVDDGLWDDNWHQTERPSKAGLMALRVENFVLRDGPYPDWGSEV